MERHLLLLFYAEKEKINLHGFKAFWVLDLREESFNKSVLERYKTKRIEGFV